MTGARHAALALGLFAAAPAAAQMAPYDDFAHAPRHYAAKAKAGDAQAQFYLGLAIEALGADAAARWGAAEDWYAKAAKAGAPEAAFRLGQLALARGDRGQANMRFVAAAIGGMAAAQFNAGRLAAEAENASSALRWYRAAARQGHAPAQYNLALYLLEQDAEANGADALAWLTLAAEAGAPDAANARAALVEQLPAETVRAAAALAAERRPQ